MKIALIILSSIFYFSFSFASELFMKINANGNFTVSLMGQTQTNQNNVFRFFDLPGGNISVQITNIDTGRILFNKAIELNYNERLVVEINNYGILNIVEQISIQNVNWYTTTVGTNNNNSATPNYPNFGKPNQGNHNKPGDGTTNFNTFLNSFNKESFEDSKLKMANNYVSNQRLSAEQIAKIVEGFSFDSTRLKFAKYAYKSCYDKSNYFLLKEKFSFSSTYDDLLDYISK